MKKQLVLFILLFCCFSCASQKKDIITKSAIKLEGKNTNVRDLLEIDGYYSQPNLSNHININNMFFEDGTFVNFGFNEGFSENDISRNMSKAVYKWVNDDQISWGTYWGVFKIEGDTIITYYYSKGSFWANWIFREIRYKIKDRTTIIPIYSKGLLKYDEQNNINTWISNGQEQIFHPADSLPSSDNWLKEEKWIWRNEQDWKDYMQKIKEEKKGK